MTLEPKRKNKQILGYFEDSGSKTKKYPLLSAVYNDRTQTAKKIVATDPDQINSQDPFAGLTALHIAIFRQNEILVDLLAKHPQADLQITDNFNRRAIDMLDYTANQRIFETIVDATYPEETRSLEDEAYEQGKTDDVIVPFKPKEP
jgi:ankyrin repeat protein